MREPKPISSSMWATRHRVSPASSRRASNAARPTRLCVTSLVICISRCRKMIPPQSAEPGTIRAKSSRVRELRPYSSAVIRQDTCRSATIHGAVLLYRPAHPSQIPGTSCPTTSIPTCRLRPTTIPDHPPSSYHRVCRLVQGRRSPLRSPSNLRRRHQDHHRCPYRSSRPRTNRYRRTDVQQPHRPAGCPTLVMRYRMRKYSRMTPVRANFRTPRARSRSSHPERRSMLRPRIGPRS